MTIPNTSTKNNSIEARLAPWIDQAEYIIGLTLIIMAWAAGWVDLLAFESFTKQIFGRYSVSFFSVLVVYTLGFGFWFWLIFSLDALERAKRFIAYVQRTPLVALLIYIAIGGAIYSTTIIKYWSHYTLLQGTLWTLSLVFTAFLLFTNLDSVQVWRKVVWGLLGVIVAIEVVMHGLAFAGALPLQNTSGLYQSYGRVYTTGEHTTYAMTNRYGWYYPEFVIDDENYNVILNGDTFVRGWEANYDAVLGAQLQANFPDDTTQIMPMGQPGFGANTYLSPQFYNFIWGDVQADEMIVFVHLANDFQLEAGPLGERPSYEITENGNVRLNPADSLFQHVIHHVVFAGHQPLFLAEIIMSHSFIVTGIRQVMADLQPPVPPYELHAPPYDFMRERVPQYRVPMPMDARTPDMPFGHGSFLFEVASNDRAEDSYTIMFGQLVRLRNYLAERDIEMRIVTIPFFPEAFYNNESGTNWNTELGSYDVLLPEDRLARFAEDEDIPFLAMGRYMQDSGVSVDDVQALYLDDGVGHFSDIGHQYFAEAVYMCFYDTTANDSRCQN